MSATDMTRVEQRIAERIQPSETRGLRVDARIGGLVITDMSQLLEFAKIMAIGGVAVPKYLRGNPGACVAVTLNAVEWGFSPFNVANKSYSVNDRIAYEAQLIHAVILKRAPIKGRPKSTFSGEGATRRCTVTGILAEDDSVLEYTSPELGKITPQNSPLWKSDTDQQLHYYSTRAWSRRHFPDVILGVEEREEAMTIDAQANPPAAARSLDDKIAALGADSEFEDGEAKLIEQGEAMDADAMTGDADMDQTPWAEPHESEFKDPDQDAVDREPTMVDRLTEFARKGPRALRMAMGKLTQDEAESLGADDIAHLTKVSLHAARNTGEDVNEKS